MRVLDLDMDFFLSGPCPLAVLGDRPAKESATPWDEAEVVRFLEDQCGLSLEHPVPGAIFDTHDKALDYWAARLADGSLTAPFEVAHVDTHSDLAFGPPGTNYVLNVVLSRLPDQRAIIDTYREAVELDEANYLLFALAFRWIDRLSYVRNPKSHQDIPCQLLNAQGDIRLCSFISRMMEARNGPEPVIPFAVYDDYTKLNTQGYDFVTLAQSPRYAPASADFIMDIVSRYIIQS